MARGTRVARGLLRGWLPALVLSLLVALLAAELLLRAALAWPAQARRVLPAGFFGFVRELHLGHERDIVHFDERFAEYDPGLFYRLRPGTFRFASREFDTGFRVNSAGLRDDEESLVAPEIIVLGDSYAMGWGVEQEETFPQVLERLSGRRVLNAGMSSYGTAREMMLLDRLDTSRLRYLIVQYHDSDLAENWLLSARENRLPISPPEVYQHTVEIQAEKLRPFFGRYAWLALRRLLSGDGGAEAPARAESRQQEAALFLNALAHAGQGPPQGTRLVVLEIADDPGDFAPWVRAGARRPSQPAFVRELRVVDLAGRLGPEHFYVLDDHLRPSGHEVIAGAILDLMRGWEASEPPQAGAATPRSASPARSAPAPARRPAPAPGARAEAPSG